eukprot:3133085-Amphidinium_carterae.1
MGTWPAKSEEPTPEQLAAIKCRVDQHKPPYVDLSIFGPHGARTQRRMQFTCLLPQEGGTLSRVQVYGPSTYQEWEDGYVVLQTALIMLGLVCPGHCVLYKQHIQRLSNRYGPAVWGLLYQADARARREQMQWCRR